MKKIILVNPYNPLSDHIQPPLGLGYLATSLRKNNFEILIIDANKEHLNVLRLVEQIKRENPSFVGFQFYTSNFKYIKEGLQAVKKINSNIITLVGGPHPSALPEQVFSTLGSCLDFAFQGEAEIGLPMLLKGNIHLEKIPGLIFRKNNQIVVNPPHFEQELDRFDYPAWDLLRPETYPEAQHGAFFEKFPIAPIITSRGCPFSCSFCAGKQNTGTIFRKRSVENVIKEMKYLYEIHNIREFHIVDDNFTLDKCFAKEILKEIIKLNLDASFAVPNGIRLDSLDEEILLLMKKAGFYLISAGIESGSDRILRLMNKHLTIKKIKEKISLIKKTSLDLSGFFILGYPDETVREIKKTIKFSLNLGLLRANYFLFLPLPGTPIFEKLRKNKLLEKIDFNRFSFTKPTFTNKIKKKRLKKLQREAFIRFYLFRPKILLKNLQKIKRPKQVIFLLKRAVHWLI